VAKTENSINKTIIFAALIVGTSILGFGLINTPARNKAADQEMQRLERREKALDDCLSLVEGVYNKLEKDVCEGTEWEGKVKIGEYCILPDDLRREFEEIKKGGKEECYKRYPPTQVAYAQPEEPPTIQT